VLALGLDTARTTAVIVVAVAVGLALVGAWVVRAVVGKLVAIVLLGGLAAAVWSQRESLQDCADRVGATLPAGAVDETTCEFLGRAVTITSVIPG
jgi:hypothetical protein